MIIQLKDIGEWSVKKYFDDDFRNTRQNVIVFFTNILNKLISYKLLSPQFFNISPFDNFVDEKNQIDNGLACDIEYWSKLLPNKIASLNSFEIYGTSELYEDNKLVSYERAVFLSFYPFWDGYTESYVEVVIKIRSDNFLPYKIIDTVKKNHDYEKNQNKLTAFFTDISEDFQVSYENDDLLAIVDGYNLKCRIYDNEILAFSEFGRRLDWIKIEDTNLP